MQLTQHHIQFKAMGGPCDVHFWLDAAFNPETLANTLEAEVVRLEQKYSRFLSTSLLSKINSRELNGASLDEETVGLFNYVEQCYELSDHMFDPTVGILRKHWDFKIAKLPDALAMHETLNDVGWSKVHWNGVSLNLEEGVQIDLGGVVKEFAADRLCTILKEQKVSGLVNLAGDIAVSFPPPNADSWKIAIQHPRKEGAIATINLTAGGLACSGDYERFIEVDGQRYCHILKPDTGFPVTNGLCSVSVIAESCLMAGTVTTVALLKEERGIDWLQEIGLPYLAFDQNLKAYGKIGA